MQRSGLLGILDTAVASTILFGLFLLAALGTLSLFTLINKNKDNFGWMAALSLGIGPMTLSWVLTMALRYYPGQPPQFYLWGLTVFFAALALPRVNFMMTHIMRTTKQHFSGFNSRPIQLLALVFTGLTVLLLTGLFSIGASLPLIGNDPLEYAQAARLIFEAGSANVYPFIDSTQTGGFYGPWTHPLGYINLLTLGYMIQGSANYAGIIHLVAPYFAFASVVAIWNFSGQSKPLAGPIAALVLISTPLYFQMTAQAHIDTTRMFTYFSIFVAAWGYLRAPTLSSAIIVGLCVGLSQFSHSIGILSLPVLIPIMIIMSKRPFPKLLVDIFIISLIGVLIVLPSWMDNIRIYGSLAADQVEIWTFPSIHYAEHLAAVRQLTTPLDKIFFGIFKGFSQPANFGFSYYIFIIALFVFYRTTQPLKNLAEIWQQKSFKIASPLSLALWGLAGYYGIVTLSALLGMDLIIKNSRYILTVQPLVSIVIAIIVSDMVTRAVHSFNSTFIASKSGNSNGKINGEHP